MPKVFLEQAARRSLYLHTSLGSREDARMAGYAFALEVVASEAHRQGLPAPSYDRSLYPKLYPHLDWTCGARNRGDKRKLRLEETLSYTLARHYRKFVQGEGWEATVVREACNHLLRQGYLLTNEAVEATLPSAYLSCHPDSYRRVHWEGRAAFQEGERRGGVPLKVEGFRKGASRRCFQQREARRHKYAQEAGRQFRRSLKQGARVEALEDYIKASVDERGWICLDAPHLAGELGCSRGQARSTRRLFLTWGLVHRHFTIHRTKAGAVHRVYHYQATHRLVEWEEPPALVTPHEEAVLTDYWGQRLEYELGGLPQGDDSDALEEWCYAWEEALFTRLEEHLARLRRVREAQRAAHCYRPRCPFPQFASW